MVFLKSHEVQETILSAHRLILSSGFLLRAFIPNVQRRYEEAK